MPHEPQLDVSGTPGFDRAGSARASDRPGARVPPWRLLACSAGLGLASILLLVRNGVYAAMLPVADFGRLNQLLLIASMVASFGGLGMQLLAQKRLPLLHAQQDVPAANALVAAAMATFLVIAGVLAAALLAIGVLADLMRPLEVLALSAFATAQFVAALCLVDVRSAMQLERHALYSILRAAGALGAGCAAVWIARRVDWLLIGEAFATAGLGWLALNAARRAGVLAAVRSPREITGTVRGGIRSAARLLLLYGIMIILFAADRWAGVVLLDREDYGYYALGLTMLIAFDSLQAIATVPAWPLVARGLAGNAYTRTLRTVAIASGAVMLAGVLLYWPCMLALEAIITRFLPRYASSIDVMYVVAIAGVLRLCNFFGVYAILSDMEAVLVRRHALALGAVCFGMGTVFGLMGVPATPVRIGLIAVLVSAVVLCVDAATALGAMRIKLKVAAA